MKTEQLRQKIEFLIEKIFSEEELEVRNFVGDPPVYLTGPRKDTPVLEEAESFLLVRRPNGRELVIGTKMFWQVSSPPYTRYDVWLYALHWDRCLHLVSENGSDPLAEKIYSLHKREKADEIEGLEGLLEYLS